MKIRQLPKSRAFTLIELMFVVAIIGSLAAVAIPAMSKNMKQAKTSEAKASLGKMFDANVAFFQSEHAQRGTIQYISAGGKVKKGSPHRCPQMDDQTTKGSTGLTPSSSVSCAAGPGGKCIPSGLPSGTGYYPISVWGNNTWNGLNFQQEQGHHFHYQFNYRNTKLNGHGRCKFTAQAFGDLDGDGLFSTFERAGAADEDGVNAGIGLYTSNEIE